MIRRLSTEVLHSSVSCFALTGGMFCFVSFSETSSLYAFQVGLELTITYLSLPLSGITVMFLPSYTFVSDKFRSTIAPVVVTDVTECSRTIDPSHAYVSIASYFFHVHCEMISVVVHQFFLAYRVKCFLCAETL